MRLGEYALVITTYSVVRLDWKKWLAETESPLTLHAIRWGRVVLDEGMSTTIAYKLRTLLC